MRLNLIFLNFEVGFGDSFFQLYVFLLYASSAHYVCILELVNIENLGRHEAHGRFLLLCKNNTDEKRTLVQRISNYIYEITTNNEHIQDLPSTSVR